MFLRKQLVLEAGRALASLWRQWAQGVSPKPPPGLEAALVLAEQCPGSFGRPEEALTEAFLFAKCLVRLSRVHSQSNTRATEHPVWAARAGTQSTTRGWAAGQRGLAKCRRASRGRPKCCSNPAGLSAPAPYLSLKGIFKPFKMASSGFQGDGAKVITAMETLSLA